MKKFFAIISVSAVCLWSSAVVAQPDKTSPRKARIVERKVVQGPPNYMIMIKKESKAVQKKMIKLAKKVPLSKKSLAGAAGKKQREQSLFWIFVKNPFAMTVWIPLLLTGIIMVIRFVQLFPRRERPVKKTDMPEDDEFITSWDQRAWSGIKDFFDRCRKNKMPTTL